MRCSPWGCWPWWWASCCSPERWVHGWVVAILVGMGIVGVAARDWLSIVDVVKSEDAFKGIDATAAFGFYLTIAGGVVTALAGVMPAKKS